MPWRKVWFKSLLFAAFSVFGTGLSIAFLAVPHIYNHTYEAEEKYALSSLENTARMAETVADDIAGYRRDITETRKKALKDLVSSVYSFMENQHSASVRGEISEDAAKKRVIDTARSMLFGKKDYFYISDYSSRILSHPDPKLQGADLSRLRDVNGKLIVPEVVKVALEKGEGYTHYWWNRLGEKNPVEKLVYSRVFSPWEWVVATGVYTDDIETEANAKMVNLMGELENLMRSVKLGRTGYMFLFDSSGQMIIHPNAELRKEDFSKIRNPGSQTYLMNDLILASQTPSGKLAYKWDKQGDRGNFSYQKIAWVRHIPQMGWYMVSAIYADELAEASSSLSAKLYGALAVVMIVVLFLAAVLMNWLMEPIYALSETAMRVREGDLNARTGIERKDEIGLLAQEFDHMVSQLQENMNDLDAKIIEKARLVEESYQHLVYASQQMMDAMEYAWRIQAAILPTKEEAAAITRDFFVYYKPKEMLGGDIYWLRGLADGSFIAAMVDCTGHSVPGAIMTMIATTCMDRVVVEKGVHDPEQVLNTLNPMVQRLLNQHLPDAFTDDGFDMCVVRVDYAKGTVVFAGARMDLYLCDGTEVKRVRGNRHSVGYRSSDPAYRFARHELEVGRETRFYTMTDGLLDQVGGEEGLPFGRKRFEKFALETHAMGFRDQRRELVKRLEEYMGSEQQRDDITVGGFGMGSSGGTK